jgi:hypothetical protein
MYTSLSIKCILEGKAAAHIIEMYIALIADNGKLKRTWLGGKTAMTIEEVLVKEYGPLLSFAELAMILDRSPDGLRTSLRSSGEWVRRINAARLRLGRRVYFRTSEIANVLDAR